MLAERYPNETLCSWIRRDFYKTGARPLTKLTVPGLRYQSPLHHPDIGPRDKWLKDWAWALSADLEDLSKATMLRQFPGLSREAFAWTAKPKPCPAWENSNMLIYPQTAWCTRCLASDYLHGRDAHIRQDWRLSVVTFCKDHRWPLSDCCEVCRSQKWDISKGPDGPLRMVCADCFHPLEMAGAESLQLEERSKDYWEILTNFEACLRNDLFLTTMGPNKNGFCRARRIGALLKISEIGLSRGEARETALDKYFCSMVPHEDAELSISSGGSFSFCSSNLALRRQIICISNALLGQSSGAAELAYSTSSEKLSSEFYQRMSKFVQDSFYEKYVHSCHS